MILGIGSCVRIAGVDGFGFIQAFHLDDETGVILVSVQVYIPGSLVSAPVLTVPPRDLKAFKNALTKAIRTRAHVDDHHHAALMMIDPEAVF